jgi:hypothetical protein
MRPFNEGYQAFKEGNLDNPYNKNTKNHKDWEYGFTKAYHANLERIGYRRKAETRSFKVQSGSQKENSPIQDQADVS